MKFSTKLFLAAFFFAAIPGSRAALLYDLTFSGSNTGSYFTVFGTPSVQTSVGPLTNALVFHAVKSYDQIQLPINVKAPGYDIQYDVITHGLLNSNYNFALLLDTPEVRRIDFDGGSDKISVFQPSSYGQLINFSDDQVYHFDISVNLTTARLAITINGAQEYSAPLDATAVVSLRFSMAPNNGSASVTDAPGTYAAIDNVIISTVPEPGTVGFGVSMVLFAGLGVVRRRPAMIVE